MDFSGRVAFITGGARGQGRSHAVEFARRGADVVICDLCGPLDAPYRPSTAADLEATRGMVEREGRTCLAYQADVRSPGELEAVVDAARRGLGAIDILVANAGIIGSDHIRNLTHARFESVVATNLGGVFNSIKAVLPGMLERDRGRIIAISSMAGRRPYGHAAHYAASKWGVIGMVKDIALDLARTGITANVVCPSSVNTEMAVNEHYMRAFQPEVEHPTMEEFRVRSARLHPQGIPWVEVEDVSAAVLFLASDQARHVTGDVISVSAGMMASTSA